MTDILIETQNEVTRLNDMISTTKAFFPKKKHNFIVYEIAIKMAETAIREHNITALVRMLPKLKSME